MKDKSIILIVLIITSCQLAIVVNTLAQDIKVTRFYELDAAAKAVTFQGNEVTDQNGERCALIKINTNINSADFTYDVGLLGVMRVEHGTDEIRLFVPHGVKYLNISHKKYATLKYTFPHPIEKDRVYQMYMSVSGNATKDSIVSPHDTIDNVVEDGNKKQQNSIEISSFKLEELDLTANIKGTMVFDRNGERCALIKIMPRVTQLTFDIGHLDIIDVKIKKSETWLYVPHGIKFISISHQDYGTARFDFPVNIQEARTYRMSLKINKPDKERKNNIGLSFQHYLEQSIKPYMGKVDNGNRLVCKVGNVPFHLIRVDGGTFQMGATKEMKGELDIEKPVHQVTLSTYYIGETEVTQGLWKAVMDSNPSRFRGNLKRPVERIDYMECLAFIEKLSKATGLNFRLPTEAEWEFAARGGIHSKHTQFSGGKNLDEVGWTYSNSVNSNGVSCTHPVKSLKPNELSIYDMTGNVREWCSDWFAPYTKEPQINPTGPETGDRKIFRGGAYHNKKYFCRISRRHNNVPTYRKSGTGMRLALTINDDTLKHIPEYVPEPKTSSQKSLSFTIGDSISFVMKRIKGGTFCMGGTSDMDIPYDDEKPTHHVTIDNYYIGETEVTQEIWKTVMGNNPSVFRGDRLPVECVSWLDCQRFIKRLNKITGRKFRLPTEAEWEFAARGGNNSKQYKFSGSDNLLSVAWYKDNSDQKTHDVKTSRSNELGLYDMSGNVWEWCQDCKMPYPEHRQKNPLGVGASDAEYVIRGGCWDDIENDCRPSMRNECAPNDVYSTIGFRLALSE